MNSKFIGFIAVFIVLIGVLVLNNQSTDDSIELGAILNMTGTYAFQGENARDGINLAIEEINSKGGVLGKSLSVNIQDNNGDNPAGALDALFNLTSRNTRLIIGPNLTPSANVVSPILEQKNALMIAPSVGSEKFAERSSTAFNVFPPNMFESYELAERLYAEGKRNIAIFSAQQEWMMDQGNFVKEKFEELGGRVTTMELPLTDNLDLRNEALRIKTSNPDAIVFTNYSLSGVASKRLRDIQVNVPMYSVLLAENDLEESEGALEGLIFISTDTVNDEFNQKFEARYDKSPGFPASQAYDAVYIIAEAVKKSGSVEPLPVASAINAFGAWDGASGDITFDENGNALKTASYYFVKNGEIIPEQQ